jgi:SprT-like family
MRRLLSILLLLTLWFPAQAQQVKKPAPTCEAPVLPYTTGEMQATFDTYNREYWDGKLPKTVVVWTGLTKRYGETEKQADGSFLIRLDAVKNKEQNVAKTTLLHEMCHVKTYGQDKVDHGDRWHAELHRIMLEGAFDDLV